MKPDPRHPELSRTLGLGSSLFIVVASMIGTGIFTTSGFIIEKVHSPYLLMAAWIVGGVLALSGALCYGELGAMFPQAGGDYIFLRRAFGKRIGFLSGWVSLVVGFSAPIAASGAAFGGYAQKTLPPAWQPYAPPQALAIGAILILSWIHASGLKAGSRAQNALTAFNLGLILLLVTFGFLSSRGSLAHFSAAPISTNHFLSRDFFSSCILVSFAYSGWNAIGYLGGEIKTPERNIPRAIFLGTLFVTGLYVVLNILFVYAVEPLKMAGVQDIGRLAAVTLLGGRVGIFFGAGIALVLLSCLSAMIVTGPRVYYAMAKDGTFFDAIARLHSKHRAPVAAILLQAAIAIVLVLTSTFYSLLIYIGSVITLFASLTVIAMIYLRIRRPRIERPYKTWGYPVTPLIFIAGNAFILWAGFRSEPMTFLWGALTLLAGLVGYSFFRKKTNRKL